MPAEIPPIIITKLEEQRNKHAFRQLSIAAEGSTDLTSNDYLGLARVGLEVSGFSHGSGGSRLLSGNHPAAGQLEMKIAAFHHAPSALLFNSGYDANLGLLGSLPQEGDSIFYDILSHASIRDGIRLSRAEAFAFLHNDLADLERRLMTGKGSRYVVTESVFSMDGDLAPLKEMVELCTRYGAFLIVDEAHATGVIGERGEGLVQMLGLEGQVFARIHTFGKALGCHGAVVLGDSALKDYLVNFSRPLIYSTALSPAAIEAIRVSYDKFPAMHAARAALAELVKCFQSLQLPYKILPSSTPIQGIIIPGNEAVTAVASLLQQHGFDCRPIRYPTVPKGKERIRIVLHAFNAKEEIQRLGSVLAG